MSGDQATGRRGVGTKVAHSTMREVNRSIVLDILRQGRPVSRVDLARRTRLSKPTVSSIIEDLLDTGLVREVGTEAVSHRTGRPPSLLVYNERAVAFAGIQFGVHTTHVVVADGLGTVVASATAAAVHGDLDQSVRDARAALRNALAQSGMKRDQLRAAGAAVPGLIEAQSGTCVLAPNLDWHDAPVRVRLAAALGVPTVVANTTHAAAMAEARHGTHDDRALVWVYAGTGIGSGVVIDGALFTGAGGFSGEVGHSPAVDNGIRCSCGNHGCIETVASTAAILRHYASLRGGRRRVTVDAVARLAEEGDADALSAFRQAGDHLGRGIAYLVNVLSPSIVVLGGPLVTMSSAYVSAVRESVERHALPQEPVPIAVTQLGPNGPLLGVIQLAMGAATPSYRVVDQVLVG